MGISNYGHQELCVAFTWKYYAKCTINFWVKTVSFFFSNKYFFPSVKHLKHPLFRRLFQQILVKHHHPQDHRDLFFSNSSLYIWYYCRNISTLSGIELVLTEMHYFWWGQLKRWQHDDKLHIKTRNLHKEVNKVKSDFKSQLGRVWWCCVGRVSWGLPLAHHKRPGGMTYTILLSQITYLSHHSSAWCQHIPPVFWDLQQSELTLICLMRATLKGVYV